ncbi:MAG: DUF86 domain-containing protein [Anaerolineae bacterium]|nr:DUF86 domain-containing protein [Anaerolineae bacterium]
MRTDETHLLDMLISARRIQEFSADLTQSQFNASQLHQSAIIRELQVIGEAARLIPDDTKAEHNGISWDQIAGMRNRLVHEYFRISLQVVWETVMNDIDSLVEQLEAIIPPPSDSEPSET